MKLIKHTILGSQLLRHSDLVKAIDISPNNKLILSTAFDETIKVWDKTLGKEKFTFTGHVGKINDLMFLDNENFISCGEDGTLRYWSINNKEISWSLNISNNSLESFSFSKKNKTLYIVDSEGNMLYVDISRKKILPFIYNTIEKNNSFNLIISEDERYVITQKNNEYIISEIDNTNNIVAIINNNANVIYGDINETSVIEFHEKRILFKSIKNKINNITLDDTKDFLFFCTQNGSIFKYDLLTGDAVSYKHNCQIYSITYYEKSKNILAVDNKGRMIILNSSNLSIQDIIKVSSKALLTITYSKNIVFVAGEDTNIYQLNLDNMNCIEKLNGHFWHVTSLVYSNKDSTLISCSKDYTIRYWKDNKEITPKINAPDDYIDAVNIVMNSEGFNIVSGCEDGSVLIWDTEGKNTLLYKMNYQVKQIEVSDDYQWLLVGDNHGESVLIEVKTKYIYKISKVNSIEWSTFKIKIESNNLVLLGIDKSGQIYTLQILMVNLKNELEWELLQNKICSHMKSKISNDLSTIIIGTEKGSIIKYNFSFLKITELEEFCHHEKDWITALDIGLHNNIIISGSWDRYAIIHKANGNILKLPHTETVRAIAISKDEKYCITSTWDGYIRLWDIKTAELLSWIENKGRGLSMFLHQKDNQNLLVVGNANTTISTFRIDNSHESRL